MIVDSDFQGAAIGQRRERRINWARGEIFNELKRKKGNFDLTFIEQLKLTVLDDQTLRGRL